MLVEPLSHLVVAGAGRNEFLERGGCNACELPKERGKATRMKIVFTVHAQQERPAFHKAAHGNHVAAEFLMRAGWWLFAEILDESFKLGCIHKRKVFSFNFPW